MVKHRKCHVNDLKLCACFKCLSKQSAFFVITIREYKWSSRVFALKFSLTAKAVVLVSFQIAGCKVSRRATISNHSLPFRNTFAPVQTRALIGTNRAPIVRSI